MKAFAIIFSSLLFLVACNSSDKQAEGKSESDLDAARNFLDAALKGDYKTAAQYMLQDSANQEYLSVSERSYQRLDRGKKDSLKSASLRFYDTKQVSDSVTVTIFANSYRNHKGTLKVVKKNGEWLVDLKYLFEHDMDSGLYHTQPKIDTIHK